ncbi:MAG: O-antigen ligase family protein [Pseudomonadota bacterium]
MLVVLLPILFQKQNSKTSGFYEQNRYYINLLDMLVIAYVVFICAMSLRGLPFTSTLRFFIDCSILILIPYFAISRSLVNTKAIEKVLFAFLILALILSMISIITELKGWKFYFLHKPYVHEFDKDTYRFGFLRVGGIIYNPAVIGMFLTAGLVSLEYFRNTLKIATLHVWLLRFLLIAAIIFSGTRAAILSACIVMVLYIFFSARHAYIRQMIIAAGVICFAAVLLFEQTPSIAKFDAHGTFDYRYQLILASIEQVKAYPFLGQINFIQSGNFDHLLQGQGIIDIVNYYIQIILEYGIVGLTLLLSIFLTAILYIYRFYTQSQIALFPDSFKYVTFGSAFLSLILSYIVYMGTISGVSYLPIFGVVLFAIMRSINHMMYMEWQEHFIKKTLPG